MELKRIQDGRSSYFSIVLIVPFMELKLDGVGDTELVWLS